MELKYQRIQNGMANKYNALGKEETRIKIWNEIIFPQFFYIEDIYYEWYGDLITYKQDEKWGSLSADEKRNFLLKKYGKRYEGDEDDNYEYAIYKNDELIGWIHYIIQNNISILKYIIIKEEHQNKGYGQHIMGWYLEEVRYIEKIKEVKLSFNYWIKGLKEFYLKFGFKEIKEPIGSHLTISKKIRQSKKKYIYNLNYN